ncbi:YtzI protein [Bacillus sp. FJAT-27245]|uniref:YtzI protein n=1 Tax=Bacillus sp. FJAT-27245 TaxID=1684144 RepID=UPI000ACA59D4|nr:YtzI protein [Bacillus sp. FJAT-27245]
MEPKETAGKYGCMERGTEMVIVMIFSIIICIAVIWLTVIVTNKAYAFKHSVDSMDSLPKGKDDSKDSTRNVANS